MPLTWIGRATATTVLALVAAGSAPGALGADRRTSVPEIGDRVRVKVRGEAATGFLAREVERRDDDDDLELRGRIDTVDLERRTIRVLGLRIALPGDVRVEGEDDGERSVEDLVPGLRVKVDLDERRGNVLVARKIEVRADQDYDERRLVGRIEEVRWRAGRPSSIRLLGHDLDVSRKTEFVGYPGLLTPSLIRGGATGRDDDDLQILGSGARRRFVVAGELRARVEAFDNADGESETDDRVVEGKVSALLGLVATLGPASAFVKVDAEREYLLESPDPFDEGESSVRVDEAYVEAAGVGSPHLTWVVGRQKFDEEREWWYRSSDLDAVRLFGRWRRGSGELSWSRTLFDEGRSPEDAAKRNLLAVARWEPDADFVLEGRWLERADVDGGPDVPVTYGVRLTGEVARRLEWRVDLARQTGTRARLDEVAGRAFTRSIDAEALDTRVIFRPRIALDPTFIVGYAYGSGDRTADLDPRDQPDTPDRSFRQTGLHRNRGKDNGTVSYRFYGEVLDPELTNLRILTFAIGLRPVRAVSIDVLHHRYRQDEASPKLRHVDIDADPDGVDPDLGEAWDLAFGYEPGRHLEIRLTAGVFRPGAAFADDVGATGSIRLQVKFRF